MKKILNKFYRLVLVYLYTFVFTFELFLKRKYIFFIFVGSYQIAQQSVNQRGIVEMIKFIGNNKTFELYDLDDFFYKKDINEKSNQ